MATNAQAMTIRKRILDAGVGLLETQGVAALTQPRVAKAAGVSQSHLTYYFPTRNRLLMALAETAVERLLDGLRAAVDRPVGADAAQVFAEMVLHHAPMRVLLGLIVAADREPELRLSLAGLIARVRHGLGGLLEANGLAASPQQVLALHAGIVGLAVMNYARQTAESEHEVRVGMAELFSRLVAGGAEGGR
jgi:AcrR family transcriptional regulator